MKSLVGLLIVVGVVCMPLWDVGSKVITDPESVRSLVAPYQDECYTDTECMELHGGDGYDGEVFESDVR